MNTRLFRMIVFLFLVLIISTGLAACISAAGKAGAVAASDPLHLPLVLNQAENPALSPIMLASNQPHPNSLALDSQNVYWTNCGTDVGSPTDGAVMVYSKSLGVFQPLVSGLSCPDLLQADSASLFWINRQWIPGFGL
jgi:DNA-binding beta-propeller fold protein YncE